MVWSRGKVIDVEVDRGETEETGGLGDDVAVDMVKGRVY